MCIPNITLSIPEDVYKKMKEHSGIKWSEVVRKAIVDYLKKKVKQKSARKNYWMNWVVILKGVWTN